MAGVNEKMFAYGSPEGEGAKTALPDFDAIALFSEQAKNLPLSRNAGEGARVGRDRRG
jgi:hypothetical protein